MRRIIPLVSLGALLILAPNVADAAQAQQSVAVPYADLDLSRAKGAAALDRRIGIAVRSLCGTSSAADPKARTEIRRCRTEARSGILRQREQAIAAARTEATLASVR